jgi:hypothetical protein
VFLLGGCHVTPNPHGRLSFWATLAIFNLSVDGVLTKVCQSGGRREVQ